MHIAFQFRTKMAPTLEVGKSVLEISEDKNAKETELSTGPFASPVSPDLSSDKCVTYVPLTLEKTVSHGMGVFRYNWIYLQWHGEMPPCC